jgi:UDPglucose 6-dehydrogenase
VSVEGISVIGIGKLGLCTAACFANKGYKVIGVDYNQEVIRAVNERRSPIFETGLDALIKKVGANLTATSDYTQAIHNSEISFIVVPTPSEESGGFSTKYVEAAVNEIAKHIGNKHSFHIVVIVSTVLPGVTGNIIRPLLEKVSGKKCGIDFGLCYSPEFIALGSVIRDFTHPDVVIVGESDPRSGEVLSEIYQKACENNPPIVRTNFYNAELAKISVNAYVTMKISFANTIAEICEKVPGGDVDVVSKILGSDSRIGKKYLSGGLAFGGPCFPRDNRALSYVASGVGCEAFLPMATDRVNQEQNLRIVKLIKLELGRIKEKRIAMLGLTYKTDTNVIEESAAIKIAEELIEEKCHLSVFDPAGMHNARQILGDGVTYASSIEECLRDAECCIIATPWPEFKKLKPSDFTKNMRKPYLIDCWRIYDRNEFGAKLNYRAIGLNTKINYVPYQGELSELKSLG